MHRAIGLVLRPAEAAARQLLYLLSLTLPAKPAPFRPIPADILRTGPAKTRPCFRLFDPRLRILHKEKRPRATPRISFFGAGEVRTIDLGTPPKDVGDDGRKECAILLRRVEALKSALDDLPRQAQRLGRTLQKRERSPRLKWRGPMRPCHPQGHRMRPLHDVDDVLRRYHFRAREALPPDSS